MNMGQIPPDAAWDDKGNPTNKLNLLLEAKRRALEALESAPSEAAHIECTQRAAGKENPKTVLGMRSKEGEIQRGDSQLNPALGA